MEHHDCFLALEHHDVVFFFLLSCCLFLREHEHRLSTMVYCITNTAVAASAAGAGTRVGVGLVR